jgi:DNA-binding NarL/FixJ family response regulator
MASQVTVAIVDDHPVVIDGITAWVERDPLHRAKVVSAGPTIEGVLIGPGADADVILLDLELEGRFVIDEIAQLSAEGRRIVVYSGHVGDDVVLKVHDAGASAFLAKHEGPEHCVDTIVEVGNDRPYVTPRVAGALIADTRSRRPVLSDQERTALRLWFQGMSKEAVARRMAIKESTVKQYINRARIKYARADRPASTAAAMLARAVEDGIIRLDEVL